MPAWNADAVTELYGAFATDKSGYTTDTVQRITGQPPITFEQWVRDNAAAFQRPVWAATQMIGVSRNRAVMLV